MDAPVEQSDLISVLDVSFLDSIFGELVDRLVHHRWALIYHTWSVLTPYRIHIHIVSCRIVSSCRLVSCRVVSCRIVSCCVVPYIVSSLRGRNFGYWRDPFEYNTRRGLIPHLRRRRNWRHEDKLRLTIVVTAYGNTQRRNICISAEFVRSHPDFVMLSATITTTATIIFFTSTLKRGNAFFRCWYGAIGRTFGPGPQVLSAPEINKNLSEFEESEYDDNDDDDDNNSNNNNNILL